MHALPVKRGGGQDVGAKKQGCRSMGTHTYVHAHTCAYRHLLTHPCVQAHACHMHTSIHALIRMPHAYIHTCTHTHVPTLMYMYMRVRAHTHACTCTMQTHTRTCSEALVLPAPSLSRLLWLPWAALLWQQICAPFRSRALVSREPLVSPQQSGGAQE